MGLDIGLTMEYEVKRVNVSRLKASKEVADAVTALMEKHLSKEDSLGETIKSHCFTVDDTAYLRISVVKTVADWRKHNFLVPWAESLSDRGVENCVPIVLELGDLKNLYASCKKILTAHDNGENWEQVAEEELPTQSGFFFGSTDYDSYYLKDIAHVYNDLQVVFDSMKEMYIEEPIFKLMFWW